MKENFELITSINNPKIKYVKKLTDKTFRRETGEFIVEGENIIKDLQGDINVVMLFVQKDKAEEYEYLINRRITDKIYMVDSKVMRALSDTVTPCGVLAVLKIPDKKVAIEGNVAVLDGVSDPGNMGTIIRTCVACSVENIIAINCVDAFSPKVVRASMGGILRVNIIEKDRDEALELLKNYQKFCLDMNGQSIYELDGISYPFAVIVGSESQGVSEIFKQNSKIISLPMSGNIESLNAAVSMSIALYELTFGKKHTS